MGSIPTSAPCYSKVNYFRYFDIDFSGLVALDIGSSRGSFLKNSKFQSAQNSLQKAKIFILIDINPSSHIHVRADAHQLPFPNDSFDLVIINNVIEHLHDPSKGVSELHRVLKPGGKAYFTIPFMFPIHEAPHDYQRFTKFGLQRLFSEFSQTEIISRGGWFSTVAELCYKPTHLFNRMGIGSIFRALLTPFLWIFVQLDRLDGTNAFTRVYFGKVMK